MKTARPLTGVCAIALAILFNVPFSVLASTFNYPDVLRGPAGEALTLFAAGGPSLILIWHAFALSAFALAPMAVALSLTSARVAERPALAIGAAIAGMIAGLAQAIGLWRWVFVVPMLANDYTAPNATPEAQAAAAHAFAVLNQYGGVAIGEHIGQLFTALFIIMVAALQWGERRRISAALGFIAALAIIVGADEGVAIALGYSGEVLSLVTIAGFAGFTLWLIATGIGLIRGEPRKA